VRPDAGAHDTSTDSRAAGELLGSVWPCLTRSGETSGAIASAGLARWRQGIRMPGIPQAQNGPTH